jgi:1,4-dihydroxy-2-naphthoate octaprenyltransferase
MLPVLWFAGASRAAMVFPLVTLPFALLLVRTVTTSTDGPTLNTALARTATLEVVFAALLAVGLLV